MIWDYVNNYKNQIRTQTYISRVTSNIASRKYTDSDGFHFCIVCDQSRFYFSEQIENSWQNLKVRNKWV